MVADRVRVRSRSYTEETGWEWESDGSGSFTVTPADGPLPRGTEVILHLKEDAKDFAAGWRIRDVVRRFSSFIPYPIRLGEGGEVLNDQKPIWVEPKSQVTEEQYTRFYQHLTHHPDETPLWHVHLAADSPIQFRAVIYGPPTNLERLGFSRLDHGLSLCAKRVLVQSECRELVPEYLRFLRGLVDSEDLPLNVSRETLQDNSVIRRIRTAIVKGVLDRLDKLAEEDAETFRNFYGQFGVMLKEGLIVDHANRERIARLLRFASSRGDGPRRRCRSTSTSRGCPRGRSGSITWAGPTTPRSPRAPTSRSSAAGAWRSCSSPTRSTSSRSRRWAAYQGKHPHFDRLGRPRAARCARRRGRGETEASSPRPRRAASRACSTCSAPPWAVGSRRSASRSG